MPVPAATPASAFDSTDGPNFAGPAGQKRWSRLGCSISIRMLPIRATFERFRRLVHDLARDLHKEVELTIEGADTELDKSVIDQLNDPLMHLIRNSMDHGIEPPEGC